MTYGRRRSSSSSASGHDVAGTGLDMELQKPELGILARLGGCNVPADGSPIQKEALT